MTVARTVSDGIALVVPADHAGDREPMADVVVAGGASRSESVRAGLAVVPAEAEFVLVHDAARPVPVTEVWKRVVDALRKGADVVVPVVPVTDTLRERAGTTVDRSRFVSVQTPQGFRTAVLRAAHASGAEGTDDASLAESAGATVLTVDGDARNIKITEPWQLAVAESLVR
jgi:2-C-methyl-D-erythritol 4-phosphate cytidylyltransferase